MDSRVTPVLRLTKSPETVAPLDRAFANHVRDVNTDLDLIDAATALRPPNPMTTPGDLIVGGVAGAPTRLGVGAAGQVLTVVGGVLTWAAPAALGSMTRLVNPGFEIWQRGTGPFTTVGGFTADRWAMTYAGTSMTVNREGTVVDGTFGGRYALSCAYVQASGGQRATIYQLLEEALAYRNRALSFSARVLTATAGVVRLGIFESTAGWTYASTYHPGGSVWQTLAFTAPISGTATQVQVGVWIEGTATVYVDNATVVVGSVPADYQPPQPADDLLRCQRYYEVLGSGQAGEVFAIGQATSASAVSFRVQYVPKVVVPTITISAAGDFGALTATGAAANAFAALAATGIGLNQSGMGGSGSSGLVAGNAVYVQALNTLARVKIEANPP